MDLSKTDREMFASMELGDMWLESGCHEVFFYLHGSKYCKTLVQQLDVTGVYSVDGI